MATRRWLCNCLSSLLWQLHMNNFPCSKAGMTSLFLVKERIVHFCHTHKQVKVKPVKENMLVWHFMPWR
jgi:hypothetical protein